MRSTHFSRFIWALLYALLTAAALLWIDSGRNLLGGLAFALHRLPRQFLLSLGGPDPAEAPALNALLAGAFVFGIALALLSLARREGMRGERSIPWSGALLGLILVYEILHLLLGPMTRHVFGNLRLSLFLPWHLVALALTLVYVLWSRRAELPTSARRSYWLSVFVLALCVLFPMTDAL